MRTPFIALIAAVGTGVCLVAGCTVNPDPWVETIYRPEARMAAVTTIARGGRASAPDHAWLKAAADARTDGCTFPLLLVEHADRSAATAYYHHRCR